MKTFGKCDESVYKLANVLMNLWHKELIVNCVKIELIFAFGSRDKDGNRYSHAIKHRGIRQYGQTRIVNLKDRTAGRADAEILIDGDWWLEASEPEQKALLDHELQHIDVEAGKQDDQGRPVLHLRKHDVDVGWFACIAERHTSHSIECRQAKCIMNTVGQLFWPEIVGVKKLKNRVDSDNPETKQPSERKALLDDNLKEVV